LAAFLLAFGRSGWVDRSYFAVILLAVFCGGWWLSIYSLRIGSSAAWGFGFLLVPATLVSIDRMTVDVALAALCVALVLTTNEPSQWGLYGVWRRLHWSAKPASC
jgi:hypothetical protein